MKEPRYSGDRLGQEHLPKTGRRTYRKQVGGENFTAYLSLGGFKEPKVDPNSERKEDKNIGTLPIISIPGTHKDC